MVRAWRVIARLLVRPISCCPISSRYDLQSILIHESTYGYCMAMTTRTPHARAAAAALGIGLPALSAYVSRGLIRSGRGGDARSRRYRSEDIRALQERRHQRRNPA